MYDPDYSPDGPRTPSDEFCASMEEFCALAVPRAGPFLGLRHPIPGVQFAGRFFHHKIRAEKFENWR